MHELSITEQIIEIAVRHGEQNQAQQVTDLYLVIGELSTVIDESVQFYWDLISEETICKGAQLHFERVPAIFKCQDCQKEYHLVEGEMVPCPQCGSTHMEVLQGKEFHLDSINII